MRLYKLALIVLVFGALLGGCATASPTIETTPSAEPPTAIPTTEVTDPPAAVTQESDVTLLTAPIVPSAVPDPMKEVYAQGVANGRSPDVFTKVGDCMSASETFLFPYANSKYDLGEYSQLQEVIDHFSTATIREVDGKPVNSFSNPSLSVSCGFNSAGPIDPIWADPKFCDPGEDSLKCELRVSNASLVLIMLGTHDMHFPKERFKEYLSQMITEAVDAGVVPILTTFPPRSDDLEHAQDYNGVVVEVAQEQQVPLANLWRALYDKPNYGVQPDHTTALSLPADGCAACFTEDNLQAGATMQNWVALMALDAVWRDLPNGQTNTIQTANGAISKCDAGSILFSSAMGGAVSDLSKIYSACADGRNVQEILSLKQILPDKWSFGSLAVSPDGRTLAFTAQVTNAGSIQTSSKIYFVNLLDHTVSKEITVPYNNYGGLAWSPDSAYVAYLASDDIYGTSQRIEIMHVESETISIIPTTDWFVSNLSWSNDWKLLYFATTSDGAKSDSAAYILEIQCTNDTHLCITENQSELNWIDKRNPSYNLAWMPIADEIIMRSVDYDATGEIVEFIETRSVNGDLIKKFNLNEMEKDFRYGFSPLGVSNTENLIAFTGGVSTPDNIYILDLNDNSLLDLSAKPELKDIEVDQVVWLP